MNDESVFAGDVDNSEGWETVLTEKERKQQKKMYAHVTIQPNNKYNSNNNNGEHPFLKNETQSAPSQPKPAPPPSSDSWNRPRIQQVFVYQDSNGKFNEKNVQKELDNLKSIHGQNISYNITYDTTYTIGRTLYNIGQRDHQDAIVLLNIGTKPR